MLYCIFSYQWLESLDGVSIVFDAFVVKAQLQIRCLCRLCWNNIGKITIEYSHAVQIRREVHLMRSCHVYCIEKVSKKVFLRSPRWMGCRKNTGVPQTRGRAWCVYIDWSRVSSRQPFAIIFIVYICVLICRHFAIPICTFYDDL